MRIPSLLIATALLGSSAWAQDEGSPYYLQFGLGAVSSEDATGVPGGTVSFDPGFNTGLAIGRHFGLSERMVLDAELEAYYQYFTVDQGDFQNIPSAVNDDARTFALMLNGILEWKFTQQFSAYGGIGFGWAKEISYSAWDSGSLSIADTDAPAFQGKLGLGYNLGGTYDMRIGYRFFKTDTLDIENLAPPFDTSELDVAQHSLEIAFRWGL